MSTLIYVVILVCAGLSPSNQSTPPYKDTAIRILNLGLEEVKAYELLEVLVAIGPRMAGSEPAEAALRLMRRIMVEIGLEEVHCEPVTVRRWTRGAGEKAAILGPGGSEIELSVHAAGFSVPTPMEGLTAPVVEVRSSEELKELGEKMRDSVVFINRPMDKQGLDMFNNAAQTMKKGRRGAVTEAARAGARAVLIRSIKITADDHPQTIVVRYRHDVPKIPVGYLSTNAADRLSAHLRAQPQSTVFLSFPCKDFEPAESYNIAGQITGSKFPNEVILLGAHIDTWDVSVGAHDDGAGCVQVVEALRLLNALGLKPKRTIRGVLFAEEEHGNAGGIAYAASKRRQGERHLVAIEADRGGFRPLGFNVNAEEGVLEWLRQWEDVLEEVGIYWFGTGWGGTTTEPLHEQGTPKISLVPDSQRYWELYHSAEDTLDKVDERELELGAVALATLAYLLAQEGVGAVTRPSVTNRTENSAEHSGSQDRYTNSGYCRGNSMPP
jgi:carboxypeptidase Q